MASRQFKANLPAQIASTFYFYQPHMQTPQKIKRTCNPPHGFSTDIGQDYHYCATAREEGLLITYRD